MTISNNDDDDNGIGGRGSVPPPPTSTKQIAGYFTVPGIVNEISLSESEWPVFALKELLDNAHDWLNDNYPAAVNTDFNSSLSRNHEGKIRREIGIRIRIEPIPNDPNNTQVFRIAIRNSNVNHKNVFGGPNIENSIQTLQQIFDYSKWHSTKRYHHRMTSGSLGDYLKRHGGMGYAAWNNITNREDQEEDNNINNLLQWKEPLIFRFNGSEFHVFVHYNRYTGESNSVVKYVGDRKDVIDYTEVKCALPVSRLNCDNTYPSPLFNRLSAYYVGYKIAKRDVKFTFDIKYGVQHLSDIDDKDSWFRNAGYNGDIVAGKKICLTPQEEQAQKQQFSSYYLDSVWRSTFSEFRDYLNSIIDKSITLRDALDTFREVRCLPKRYYYLDNIEKEGGEGRYKTVQDIAYKNNQIKELFIALRKAMQPESLNLSFKIKDRETELKIQLLRHTKGRIDFSNTHAKVITGHHQRAGYENNIDDRVFHYWIEAAIAPLTSLDTIEDAGKYDFIGAVNGTPSLDNGVSYFNDGHYTWINKGNNVVGAHGIISLLSACGFSEDTHLNNRRKASIIFLNLQTPCPEWQGSAGKTDIDLTVYQSLIADVMSKLAYKIPSLRGTGINQRFVDSDGKALDDKDKKNPNDPKRGDYRPYLRDFLKQRHADVKAKRIDIEAERITQSGCWYGTRPTMLAKGFQPRVGSDWNTVREGFTNSINKVIKELWPDGSVTRESLGIVAKARAMLYINGHVFPVTFDSREELARLKVTDMIIVEKEGVTDVLLKAAQKYRIALVATAGHFVDYVKNLMKLAYDAGKINVCVLTDYDIDGVNMWKIVVKGLHINIKRIGITKDVVTWLRQRGYKDRDTGRYITVEDVEEKHNVSSKRLSVSDYEFFKENNIDVEYLKVKRIELDSIIQKVGPAVFWEYIVHQLEIMFPNPRDYREIVPEPEPEDYYPKEIQGFIDYISDYTKSTYTKKWEEIKELELKDVKGLLNIDDKKEEIDSILKPIVQEKDKGIQKIIEKIKELKDSGELPKVITATTIEEEEGENES